MMNPAEFANIARVERDFWWFRGMNRILFALLDEEFGTQPPRRILEAGCGTGAFAALLRERFCLPVHAIDLAHEGLCHARDTGLAGMAQADIRALPFGNAVFDAVLSLDVIVHLERGREQAAFGELARVLRPGGLAVVRVSALDMLRSRHSAFTHERQRFTRGRLREAAANAGLAVRRCSYLNYLLSPIAFAKFRLWEPLFGRAPASGLAMPPAALNRALGAVLESELALLRRGIEAPFGQSLLLLARKS